MQRAHFQQTTARVSNKYFSFSHLMFRNSQRRCSLKKGVLKNFVLEYLFNKFAGFRPANVLKKDFSIGVFQIMLRTFLRKHIL